MKHFDIQQAHIYLQNELKEQGYTINFDDYKERLVIKGPNINDLGLLLSRKNWSRLDGLKFVVLQLK